MKTSIYLTDEQRKRLAREKKASGLNQSEMIRRAIDEYLARRRADKSER